MARINSPTFGRTHLGVVTLTLSMEQQMLLRTLREKARPMSAYELTNHWAPTWSLHEVEKSMKELVRLGCVQADGQGAKVYSIEANTNAAGMKS